MSGTIYLRGTESAVEDLEKVAKERARIKNHAFETEITGDSPEVVITGVDEKNSNIIKDELSDSGLKEDIIRIE